MTTQPKMLSGGIAAWKTRGSRLVALTLLTTLARMMSLTASETAVLVTRKLRPSNLHPSQSITSAAIDESGDLVAMGNPQDTRGAAFIFERDLGGPGAWGQRRMLQSPLGFDFDRYGWAPGISGETLVVSEAFDNTSSGVTACRLEHRSATG